MTTIPCRTGRLLLILAASTLGLGFRPAPVQEAADPSPDRLEDWRSDLQRMQGGSWIASNEAYRDEDEAIERFGMELRVQEGGVAATACLWAEHEDGAVQIVWRFFQGWDPVREAGLVYQSHAAGGVGLGYVESAGEGEPELVQDFWWPDGTTYRTGHYDRWTGPDTRETRSVNWNGEGWEPARTYTWVRDVEREGPC